MLFCQVTDLHVCPPGQLAYGKVNTNALTERALAAVGRFAPAPDALLVTGDLSDDGAGEAYAALLAGIRRHVGFPVFAIPGNHDRREPMRRELASLGVGLCQGPFLHYVVEDLPLRLVMLDTLVPGQDWGELCAERLAFLEASLAAAPDRPTVVAMHHPPFASGIAFMDKQGLRNPAAFAAVIARHPQVLRVLCGHIHRAIYGQVAHAPAMLAPSPCHQLALALAPDAPGAFVLEPPSFAVHRWTEGEGFASHISYVDSNGGPYPFATT
jgi:3',5'-cyclic AMP phosphodiesterase CpdA